MEYSFMHPASNNMHGNWENPMGMMNVMNNPANPGNMANVAPIENMMPMMPMMSGYHYCCQPTWDGERIFLLIVVLFILLIIVGQVGYVR